MAMQNTDICKFSKAEQDWNLGHLFLDIEAKQHKKPTASQQRNLKALLLGLSPKEASLILTFEEKSLKSAFSDIYRLIEELVDQPEKSVNYRNVPLVLAKYRKGAILLGRDDDLIELEKLKNQYKIALIKEDAGMGKSLLARHFMEMHFQKIIPINMGLSSSEVTPAIEKLSTILSQLGVECGNYFDMNLEILRKALSDKSNPVGVLIDNLEPALDKDFRFRDSNYDCLLRVLCDRNVCSFTLITSRIAPSVQGINHQQFYEYKLKGLGLAAWQKYFRDCKNAETSEALSQMRNFYAGNPEAMAKLEGIISDHDNFDGDIEAYWKKYKHTSLANPDLKHLTSVQIDYLQNHQPDVYKLLCRMGCYRYQTVPTIPHEALICLMWDVFESQHNAIVERLKKYSLIKLTKGEYYLHPATREEAVNRLKDEYGKWTEEGKEANRKAAEFWTNNTETIVTTRDGLRAFEAYNHYIAINEYELACNVIVKRRGNAWEDAESLGNSFYRLGFLESIKSAISNISPYLLSSPNLCKLYNVLGDVYWLIGEPYKAIYLHENSKKLAIEFSITNFEIVAFLNIGLCYVDLWEIQSAIDSFEKCIELAKNTTYRYHAVDSFFCLSFLNSVLNNKEKTIDLASKFFQEFHLTKHNTWSTGYRWLFMGRAYTNLLDLDKSFEMYKNAFTYAEESHYLQVKANSLTGLATIKKMQNDWEQAISYHLDSIDILNLIGARCDLAEAYFQLGLTYQAMGEYDRAEEYKAKALELFEQMEAPKQCDRVNKAFE